MYVILYPIVACTAIVCTCDLIFKLIARVPIIELLSGETGVLYGISSLMTICFIILAILKVIEFYRGKK